MGNFFLSNEEAYQQQKQQVDVFNRTGENADKNVEMGYLDMNSRMLAMEKAQYEYSENEKKWKKREEEHFQNKKKIESLWHSTTRESALNIKKNAKGDDRKAVYYKDFTLAQLEILIKNSDRNEGKNKDKNTIWNSNEFNDVATDLELLNRVGEDWNVAERYKLLSRLSQTSKKYIDTRHPLSKIGRRRKAMITALNTKVQSEMENIMTRVKGASDSSSEKIKNIGNEITPENKRTLEEACKAKFDLASMYLQENIQLKDEQVKQLDSDMTMIMESLLKYKVDGNQADNIPTRFMNAIGWSARKPKLVDFVKINEGQIRIPLYHTINSFEPNQTAKDMIEQLKGRGENNRQFLSDGNLSKGTYTAARNIEFENGDLKNPEYDLLKHDYKASEHSWEFGEKNGSMQVTSIFNEKARIIDYTSFKHIIEVFERGFGQFYGFLTKTHEGLKIESNDYKTSLIPHSANIILSFYGYNTVRCQNAKKGNLPLDYYVTWDRSAFTMEDKNIQVRRGKKIETERVK